MTDRPKCPVCGAILVPIAVRKGGRNRTMLTCPEDPSHLDDN